MKDVLRKNQIEVLKFLKKSKGFTSPTEIGLSLRPGGLSLSSWASPICGRLVMLGLAERSPKGAYKITDVGIKTLKE